MSEKNNITILLVDDDESLRNLCKEFLEEQNFRVITASDGGEALEILKQNSIDLVVCDLNMPNMDGISLLKAMKKDNINVDFMVMSGVGTVQTAVQTIKMGAVDYISKPFYLSELLIKIKKILEQKRLKEEKLDLDVMVEVLKDTKKLFLSLEISELLNNLLFYLEKMFSPSDIGIWLKDEWGELRLVRFTGKLIRKDSTVISSLKLLANYLIKKETPFLIHLIEDIALDEDIKFLSPLSKYNISLMAAPILGTEACIGVIMVFRYDGYIYLQKELNLFNLFVSQISPQISNCLFYKKLKDLNMEIMRSLARAVEAKDYYTRGHSENVAFYAVRLGTRLKLPQNELDTLYWAGILHDVGKIGIPDNILNKPSKLTQEEFEIMKKHPVIGMDILSNITTIKEILPLVYHHHERYDGLGYPEGIKDENIPKLTRILSVVDAFDAMTSNRAYRKAMAWDKVRSILREGAGTQWDPEFVDVWIEIVEKENILKNKNPKGEKSDKGVGG